MGVTSSLAASNLQKTYDGSTIIDSFTFSLPAHQITSLLAPSGAGKSTLLRLLACLDRPTAGQITLRDAPVTAPQPDIILVPQADTLFPHLTVRDQIAFGYRLRHNKNRVTQPTAYRERIMRELGIIQLHDRYPRQLSGGQRQRVSLARALAVQPAVLLCDEPFSALDEAARQELRMVVRQIGTEFRQTILFVTHSIQEGAFLADEMWVGVGPPLQITSRLRVPFGSNRTEELFYEPAFTQFCKKFRDRYQAEAGART